MQRVRVGVIGAGRLGSYFTQILMSHILGATVSAISAKGRERAEAVRNTYPSIEVFETGEAVIASDQVDAVLIATPSQFHFNYVKLALKAGKPVFCEKPLADRAEHCLEIVRLEAAQGRRLLQLGFMRRFDAAHLRLKEEIRLQTIGTPVLVHATHRNPWPMNPGRGVLDTMNDSAIHSLDFFVWLLEDAYRSVRVFQPPRSKGRPPVDYPFLMQLETEKGVLISSELFLNCKYGFDSSCEIVGTEGTLRSLPPQWIETKVSSKEGAASGPWYGRYEEAFHRELQVWINGASNQHIEGPSAWDGYRAALAAEACALAAEADGEKITIHDPQYN